MPTADQQVDLQWALDTLLPLQSGYALTRRYYAGEHQRMIDNTRLASIFGRLFRNFRLNLCKPVVDSLADRLQITGFSQPDAEGEETNAAEVWKKNRMNRRAGQVHLEAISTGDAYVLVWPDEENNVRFYPHRSDEVAVDYSTSEPGRILKAAKVWKPDENTTRLTLYYPDRVERYASRKAVSSSQLPASQYADPFYTGSSLLNTTERDLYGDGGQFFPTGAGTSGAITVDKAQSFTEYRDDGPPVIENPYGVVPVFHFANNADLGERGVSELWDALPVQDMLNYLAFNILVGSEFQAFRQRWVTGVEMKRDPDTGAVINPFTAGWDKVWAIEDPEGVAKFGEFASADLTQLDNVKRSAALDMAQVTQTPPHYFFSASNLVSGESQKTAEQKLDAKVTDRQTSFGDVWASAVALAVRMERGLSADGLELDTNWKDTKPRNELESWEVAQIKSELGVSKEQILREMGYTDDQIEQFRQEDGGPGQVPPTSPLDALLNGSSAGSTRSPLDTLNLPT